MAYLLVFNFPRHPCLDFLNAGGIYAILSLCGCVLLGVTGGVIYLCWRCCRRYQCAGCPRLICVCVQGQQSTEEVEAVSARLPPLQLTPKRVPKKVTLPVLSVYKGFRSVLPCLIFFDSIFCFFFYFLTHLSLVWSPWF